MKNIIPFKKEVLFKTNISEITSISLEHTLNVENDFIRGSFIVSGEYKISDATLTTEIFDFKVPFEIAVDSKYDTSRAIIDIDDFYYEVVDNKKLLLCIDVSIDRLIEKEITNNEDVNLVSIKKDITSIESLEEIDAKADEERNFKKDKMINNNLNECDKDIAVELMENNKIDKESLDMTKNSLDKNNSIFDELTLMRENFISYNVFIVREGDNITTILDKYNTTVDELKKYNDLSDLKIGDKVIIPALYERN